MHINDILDLPDLQAVIARFETFFVKRGRRECWEWQSSFAHNGYGLFTIHRKSFRAHRLSFIFYKMPLPDHISVVVRHRCDNPRCVNPAHLTFGSLKENALDRRKRGRNWGIGENNCGAVLTEQQVRSILLDTRHHKEVAADYGVASITIYRIRSRHYWRSVKAVRARVPRFISGVKGERNVRAKLTPEQVRAIRADARQYPIIAAEYGVDRETIGSIKRRVTWKHLS